MLEVVVQQLAHPTPALVAAPRRRSDRRLAWVLAVGWMAHVVVRLWMFRYHAGPVANPDETGYLVAARWMSGGIGGDLSGSTLYQGGYALLLAPAYWLSSDPEGAYRLVMGIGTMASASAFPVAFMVLRRLDLGSRAALILAFVAAFAPSLLEFSGLALTDAILPTLVLGWLLAVHDFMRYGSARAGVVAGVLSGYAMAVHMRGLVILGVFALIILFALLRARREPGVPGRAPDVPGGPPGIKSRAPGIPGRAPGILSRALGVPGRALGVPSRRVVLVSAGAGLAAAGLAKLLNDAVAAAIYPGGARDLSGLLLTRMTSLDGQLWAISGAIGQVWYLIVGTWGLAGIGLAAAGWQVARRGSRHRAMAAVLLITTLGIAYTSSAALPDEQRVGNFVYGRYLACVAVAWTLVGLVALIKAARKDKVILALASAGLAVASGGLASWYAGDRLRTYVYIGFDFPETAFLSGVRDHLDLVGATAAALILLACVTAAATIRPLLLVAALAAANLAFAVDLAPKQPPGADWLFNPPPGRVAIDKRLSWSVWVPLMHRVWWTGLERFDRIPPDGVCTAVLPPHQPPPPPGWTQTGTTPHWTTWSGPACAPK